MGVSTLIGVRYLRARKRSAVFATSIVATLGVALGVASLVTVSSTSSGFQDEFRDKVLGVNAHIIISKYGRFDEYRDVLAKLRAMPAIAGAGPFEMNTMMLVKGGHLASVLVKGIDPVAAATVIDLPEQLREGDLGSLASHGTAAPSPTLPIGKPQPDAPPQQATAESHPSAVASLDELPALPSDETEAQLVSASDDPEQAPSPDTNREAQDAPGMIVGSTLAETLELHVGDLVRVTSPLSGLDPSFWGASEAAPPSREFKITGIFHAGFQEYDSRLVYVGLEQAQYLSSRGDTVAGIEVRLTDYQAAPKMLPVIDAALRDKNNRFIGYNIVGWHELNEPLFQALENQRIYLTIVFGIIIIVAAFTVAATIIMMVLEKRRAIAILKAMGATDWSVLKIFLLQGLFIGARGILLGLLVGGGAVFYLKYLRFPLDPKVYLIDHLPVRVSLSEFVLTASVALSVTVLATLIPSLWAARVPPAQGVRHT